MSAPIQTLPFEILSDIMLLAVELDPALQFCMDSMALSLSQVCSSWRQVALQTPELWLRELPLVRMEPLQTRVASAATTLLLRRSADLPVAIHVCKQLPPMRRGLAQMLDAVHDVAHRWGRLTFVSLGADEEMNMLARVPGGKLQSLKTLDLRLESGEIWTSPNSDVFTSAPHLCDVSLHMENSPGVLPMPWAQLTRLSVVCESPQACLDALAQCKNVSTAKLVTSQWLTDVAVHPAVTLEHLEVLDIRMTVRSLGEDLGPFFRRLRLPTLKSLTLSLNFKFAGDIGFASHLAPDLEFFLSHAQKVEKLDLEDCIYAEDMPAILAHTPQLTHLGFADSDVNVAVDDDFLRALTYTGHRLVPKLRDLRLRQLVPKFSETALGDMIKSRWWPDASDDSGVTKLERLTLDWNKTVVNGRFKDETFTSDFRQALWLYRKQGLRFGGIRTELPEVRVYPGPPSTKRSPKKKEKKRKQQ